MKLPTQRLDDLAAFAAVVREGSFTRAAAQLGVSPSALSHSMRTLEEHLALKLLNRTTRSVSPTEAGERLYQTLAPRLAEIEAEIHALGELRGRPAGTVRITAPQHAVQTLVWPRLRDWLPCYPDIQVEVDASDRFTDIVAERYDIGVRLGMDVAKDMIALRMAPDMRLGVVGSPAYLARSGRPATPHDLSTHDCIGRRLPTHGGLMSWDFTHLGERFSVHVHGRLVCNSGVLALDAALRGLGLAWLPLDMAQPHIDSGALVLLLDEWGAVYPGYHLYYASRNASPAVQLVAQALREARSDGA